MRFTLTVGERFRPYNLFRNLHIPKSLAQCKQLPDIKTGKPIKITWLAKALFAEVAYIEGPDHDCYAGLDFLATHLSTSEDAIGRAFTILKRVGLARRRQRRNKTAVTELLWHPVLADSLRHQDSAESRSPKPDQDSAELRNQDSAESRSPFKEEEIQEEIHKELERTTPSSSSCATASPKTTTTNGYLGTLRKELPKLVAKNQSGALTRKQFSEVEATISGLPHPDLAVHELLEKYLTVHRFDHAGGVVFGIRNEFAATWPDKLQEIIATDGNGNGNSNGKPAEGPFSREQLKLFLTGNAATLRQLEGFGHIATELERLAADVDVHLDDLEKLEERLTTLEHEMSALARVRMSEERMSQARSDLEATLRPYRAKMTDNQLAMLEEQYLERWLMDKASLPRLSLFYLR